MRYYEDPFKRKMRRKRVVKLENKEELKYEIRNEKNLQKQVFQHS